MLIIHLYYKTQSLKIVFQYSHIQEEDNFLNKYQFPKQCHLSRSALSKREAAIMDLVSKSQYTMHFPLVIMNYCHG